MLTLRTIILAASFILPAMANTAIETLETLVGSMEQTIKANTGDRVNVQNGFNSNTIAELNTTAKAISDIVYLGKYDSGATQLASLSKKKEFGFKKNSTKNELQRVAQAWVKANVLWFGLKQANPNADFQLVTFESKKLQGEINNIGNEAYQKHVQVLNNMVKITQAALNAEVLYNPENNYTKSKNIKNDLLKSYKIIHGEELANSDYYFNLLGRSIFEEIRRLHKLETDTLITAWPMLRDKPNAKYIMQNPRKDSDNTFISLGAYRRSAWVRLQTLLEAPGIPLKNMFNGKTESTIEPDYWKHADELLQAALPHDNKSTTLFNIYDRYTKNGVKKAIVRFDVSNIIKNSPYGYSYMFDPRNDSPGYFYYSAFPTNPDGKCLDYSTFCKKDRHKKGGIYNITESLKNTLLPEEEIKRRLVVLISTYGAINKRSDIYLQYERINIFEILKNKHISGNIIKKILETHLSKIEKIFTDKQPTKLEVFKLYKKKLLNLTEQQIKSGIYSKNISGFLKDISDKARINDGKFDNDFASDRNFRINKENRTTIENRIKKYINMSIRLNLMWLFKYNVVSYYPYNDLYELAHSISTKYTETFEQATGWFDMQASAIPAYTHGNTGRILLISNPADILSSRVKEISESIQKLSKVLPNNVEKISKKLLDNAKTLSIILQESLPKLPHDNAKPLLTVLPNDVIKLSKTLLDNANKLLVSLPQPSDDVKTLLLYVKSIFTFLEDTPGNVMHTVGIDKGLLILDLSETRKFNNYLMENIARTISRSINGGNLDNTMFIINPTNHFTSLVGTSSEQLDNLVKAQFRYHEHAPQRMFLNSNTHTRINNIWLKIMDDYFKIIRK